MKLVGEPRCERCNGGAPVSLTRPIFSARKPPCARGSYPSVVLDAVDPSDADRVEIRRLSFRLAWAAQNEPDRIPSVYSIPRVVDHRRTTATTAHIESKRQ